MLREGEERVAGPLAEELAPRVGERVQAREVGLGDTDADGPGAETLGAILHRPFSFWRPTIPARAGGNNVQCWIHRGDEMTDLPDADVRERALPYATLQGVTYHLYSRRASAVAPSGSCRTARGATLPPQSLAVRRQPRPPGAGVS